VTPLHPRTNGEVERFMQNVNMTEKIANLQAKTVFNGDMWFKTSLSPTDQHCTQLQELHLIITKSFKGTLVRTKLQRNDEDDIADRRDAEYKHKMKQQIEVRKTRENNLQLGSYVLVKLVEVALGKAPNLTHYLVKQNSR